jgi:hypothetical protein
MILQVLTTLLVFSSVTSNMSWEKISDGTPPSIQINFAGNLLDSGGPAWLPPESDGIGLTQEGYYVNDSLQHEPGIYINLTVMDLESAVTKVWLNWMSFSVTALWTNWTYNFEKRGDFWEIDTDGIIPTVAGYRYSFDIVAISSGGHRHTCWNKTGLNDITTRRYVQLNCPIYNISYKPYYLWNATYGSGIYDEDWLHHDQGSGTLADTGYLLNDTLTDIPQRRCCGAAVWYWFDEQQCAEGAIISNVYVHTWFESNVNHDGNVKFTIGTNRTAEVAVNIVQEHIQFLNSDKRSGPLELWSGDSFSLMTGLLTLLKPLRFSDNNISELAVILFAIGGTGFSQIEAYANKSAKSFVIFNVPSNETLFSVDSDSDGLTDRRELYISYTDPFSPDTDEDGQTDGFEATHNSDPNDYTSRYLDSISGKISIFHSLQFHDVMKLKAKITKETVARQ